MKDVLGRDWCEREMAGRVGGQGGERTAKRNEDYRTHFDEPEPSTTLSFYLLQHRSMNRSHGRDSRDGVLG